MRVLIELCRIEIIEVAFLHPLGEVLIELCRIEMVAHVACKDGHVVF